MPAEIHKQVLDYQGGDANAALELVEKFKPLIKRYVVDARRFDLVHCHGAGQHSGKRRRDGRARPTGFKGSAGESTQGI